MTTPEADASWFDHDRLDVYGASLDFVTLTYRIIARFPRGCAPLADQLNRAAASIALNTAEGSGEFRSREKARFYRMALRSAAECSAILDIGLRQHLIAADEVCEGKRLLGRIAAMLTMLVRRHDTA